VISKTNPAQADTQIINAYKHVFKEHGKDAQVDIVLGDLAALAGFYDVPPQDSTALQYARDAGRREVFARILFLLGVTSEYREALRKTAEAINEALATKD
jgi:rhodanese-related sulfurtransferase